MTYYVKNRSVVYKQGLNELLPPFVLAAAAGLADRAGWEGGAEDVESAGTGTVDAEAVERVAPDAVVYQMLERTVAKVRAEPATPSAELVHALHCVPPPPTVPAHDVRGG